MRSRPAQGHLALRYQHPRNFSSADRTRRDRFIATTGRCAGELPRSRCRFALGPYPKCSDRKLMSCCKAHCRRGRALLRGPSKTLFFLRRLIPDRLFWRMLAMELTFGPRALTTTPHRGQGSSRALVCSQLLNSLQLEGCAYAVLSFPPSRMKLRGAHAPSLRHPAFEAVAAGKTSAR